MGVQSSQAAEKQAQETDVNDDLVVEQASGHLGAIGRPGQYIEHALALVNHFWVAVIDILNVNVKVNAVALIAGKGDAIAVLRPGAKMIDGVHILRYTLYFYTFTIH